jgi:hypothetical protein
MPVSGGRLRRTRYPSVRADPFEDWISLVITQLLAPKQLLFTRSGLPFGFWIGWHVYTIEGRYVGSFRDTLEQGDRAELYSASGDYLGERDPEQRDRLVIDLSKRGLRREPLPELPALPPPTNTLYAIREKLPPREGWNDFPMPAAFGTTEPPDASDSTHSQPRFRVRGRRGITSS